MSPSGKDEALARQKDVIEAFRKATGWTNSRMANAFGRNYRQIWAWESGQYRMPLSIYALMLFVVEGMLRPEDLENAAQLYEDGYVPGTSDASESEDKLRVLAQKIHEAARLVDDLSR